MIADLAETIALWQAEGVEPGTVLESIGCNPERATWDRVFNHLAAWQRRREIQDYWAGAA